MPTMILTPLIIEPSWAEVTKKAKNLEHIIQRCDPPATASPIYQAQVHFPAYIHSSHNHHHDENYRGNSRGPRPYRGQQGGRRPFRGSQQKGRGQQNNYSDKSVILPYQLWFVLVPLCLVHRSGVVSCLCCMHCW